MRVYIEEAVIVEVYEVEPNFPVETVRPEVISEEKEQGSFFDSLINLFTDPFESLFSSSSNNSIFSDFFNLFNDSEIEINSGENYSNPKTETPEIAVITETKERKIREFNYFYYEVVN